ncbi:jg12259 [Pararge aegeria aegeria]|uniref:Odorant receptor n=1 Tax=Pararge aegeria aegeria TaxID=348720 RepID=A0A8S4SCM7_9NEOP|nr:jg12259 [Pararge aegeria aegeria]
MKVSLIKKFWGGLEKFGLEHDDFPTMMGNVAILLRILTINIYKRRTKRISLIWYILTVAAGGCYFYVYIFSMMWQVFIHYPRLNNFAGAAVALTLGTCTVTCITKFVFMKMYANDIKETIDKFLQCDEKVALDTRFAKNLRIKLRIVKKRAIIIWVSLVSDGVIYLLIPMVLPGRHVSEDLYIIYGLEPMLESPNYEIVTFLTNTSIGFAVYTMVNVAVYVIVVVGYNESQIHALSEELSHLWSDSQNFYNALKHTIHDKIHAIYIKEQIVNEFIRIRLRDIVKFHIANINLFHELDHEFRNTLAVEYSIMTISIIAELLGGLQNTYLQLPYTMVQVFMDCLAGQRLIDACNDFENSLYACEWENFNVSNQKTVLLMLVASQKTLMLTAGGVTKLNFNCLMIIVKSTYSMYTTLKSTLK